jgi:hypothetical protein
MTADGMVPHRGHNHKGRAQSVPAYREDVGHPPSVHSEPAPFFSRSSGALRAASLAFFAGVFGEAHSGCDWWCAELTSGVIFFGCPQCQEGRTYDSARYEQLQLHLDEQRGGE